jgi:hypothetical protein
MLLFLMTKSVYVMIKRKIYMDWWGNVGYLSRIYKYGGSFVSHHLRSLHIPSSLHKLNDFDSTLKALYFWRDHILSSSKKVKLARFKNYIRILYKSFVLYLLVFIPPPPPH